MRELLAAGADAYGALVNLCVWVKSNGGMGSLYRSQHELVAVFKNGGAPIATISRLAAMAATAPTCGPMRERPASGGNMRKAFC